MDDLLSALLRLKSTETQTGDKSCFSTAVETVWDRDPDTAGDLLRELSKQAESRRAPPGKAVDPYASVDNQRPFIAHEYRANVTTTGTQTEGNKRRKAKKKKQGDLAYRPSLSTPKYTQSNGEQRDGAENETPTSKHELRSAKPPAVVDVSISCGTRDEAETLPCTSIVDPAAIAKPESAVILNTSPELEKDSVPALRGKPLAEVMSEETARSIIFAAARDIHDMEVCEGRLGEVHAGILASLKLNHKDEVFPQQLGSVQPVSDPMHWSFTMWMNVLDQGRASHKRSEILRKIEWMGASAWYEYQVELAQKNPPKTKRGLPTKRVSTAILDRVLNEAHDDGSGMSSNQSIDRNTQQRKTFIDRCNKGKRLRHIVEKLNKGVLLYSRIWDLIKMNQDEVDGVISHLSADPTKATTLALLEEQVELLARRGKTDTAKFLDAVEAKSLVSVDDASRLRLDYGSTKSEAELDKHMTDLHQVLGKRQLGHEHTVTLCGKSISIPSDSFKRLKMGEWFDTSLVEAGLEIQDRPAWVKLGLCVCTHEMVLGQAQPIKAPFRALRTEIQSLRNNDDGQRPQRGYVFLRPICVDANHFTLLEVNERERMIYHYDSLSIRLGRTGTPRPGSVRKAVLEEFKDLGFKYAEAPTPQQEDHFSCGPMVVRNAFQRMSGQPVGDWNDKLDPTKLRASIVRDLLTCISYCGVDPDPRRSKRSKSS